MKQSRQTPFRFISPWESSLTPGRIFLLECVADACLSDGAFRKALPPGFARDATSESRTREIFAGLLQRLAQRVFPQRTLDRFVDEFLASCPPLLRGQMAQLAALEQIGIDTVLAARPHLIARVQLEPHSATVRHFGRKISFPLHVAPAVRFALSEERFAVRDLPGDLEDSGKLTLARRLIREGLVAMSAIQQLTRSAPVPGTFRI